jgi:hypothetical protein
VTERVVLPPLTEGVLHAPIQEAGNAFPAGAVAWRNRHRFGFMDIFGLVYLAGLRWPILTLSGKCTKQVAAERRPRSVIA